MNIHPIFVHFPIALLTFYTLLEFLRFRVLVANESYFNLKAFLSVFGVASGAIAYQTGEIASDYINRHSDAWHLVSIHSFFAYLTLLIFAPIAASYAALFLERYWKKRENLFSTNINTVWNWGITIAHFIQRQTIICILAVFGLLVLTVTGALGAAIVYGPESDFIVSFVYHLIPSTYR